MSSKDFVASSGEVGDGNQLNTLIRMCQTLKAVFRARIETWWCNMTDPFERGPAPSVDIRESF